MTLALVAFLVSALFESAVWLPPLWDHRRLITLLVAILVGLGSAALVVVTPHLWSSVVIVLSGYRIFNVIRAGHGVNHADFMYTLSRRTSRWLMALQLFIGGGVYLIGRLFGGPLGFLYVLAGAQVGAALMLAVSTRRSLRTIRPPVITAAYADRDLPTLTVAIPARNETADLEACLQSLTASAYPKLEILVLDDCSQNKRTPVIIRDFAQAGVRFIAGEAPPEQWIAKNFAYQQLLDEANGELLVFCGVDTRFEPDSLRGMVETMLEKQKSMLSIIPQNRLPGRWEVDPLLVQPGRYAWELVLPRRWFNRPPVLSTCWLIEREQLEAAGGFKAVRRSSSPESYFARALARRSDGYSFVLSTPQIGLRSAKSYEEQRDTAIRTRYPQTHRRPELVALLSLTELFLLLLPLNGLIIGLLMQAWPLAILTTVAGLLLSATYVRIVTLTYRRFLWRSLWLGIFTVVFDVGLLNYSMWKYEFGEVLWKGRNVCVPIMRVATEGSAQK